jgi:hypothetical protein
MEKITFTPNGEFSDERFWAAIVRYLAKVGKKLVEIWNGPPP